jgi:hypothetical protein
MLLATTIPLQDGEQVMRVGEVCVPTIIRTT